MPWEVGEGEGLPEASVFTGDNVTTIPKSGLDARPVDHLAAPKRAALDRALRYALDIQY